MKNILYIKNKLFVVWVWKFQNSVLFNLKLVGGNWLKMAGVTHDQSINKVVADSHDDVMIGEELNQEITSAVEKENGIKTFSESQLELVTGVKTLFEETDLQTEE